MQALRFPKEYKILTVLLQSDPVRAPWRSSGRCSRWLPRPGRLAGVKCQRFAAFRAGKAFRAPARRCDLGPKHSATGSQKPPEPKAAVLTDRRAHRREGPLCCHYQIGPTLTHPGISRATFLRGTKTSCWAIFALVSTQMKTRCSFDNRKKRKKKKKTPVILCSLER